jgi:hypothetical protein
MAKNDGKKGSKGRIEQKTTAETDEGNFVEGKMVNEGRKKLEDH